MNMNIHKIILGFISGILLLCSACGDKYVDWRNGPVEPYEPEDDGSVWVRPTEGIRGRPVWGFRNGIRIGIHPLSGPRGLIRVYTPYTLYSGPSVDKMINFIAFEPTPHGKGKGFSEMENSALDRVQGKRFWSGNTSDPTAFPDPQYPAAGVVSTEHGVEKLRVYIFSEQFVNGADVYVRITFSADNPHRFELETLRREDSPELRYFVLSATMGNYARLRTLHLADGVEKVSTALWPSYKGTGFTDRNWTPFTQMITDKEGGVWYIASPNEENPGDVANINYPAGTHVNWFYYGLFATQYWYCPTPTATLSGAVNGRYAYWSSSASIPGGISFENFEMQENFQMGQKYVFGVTLLKPEELVRKIENGEY